jgi:peptide chain release factor 1
VSRPTSIQERLDELRDEFESLATRMGDPDVASRPDVYRELATRYAELEPLIVASRELERAARELEETRALARDEKDREVRELAKAEAADLEERCGRLREEVRRLLLPKDPNEHKSVVLEVRAGTGGDEATLFASELLRMYQRYAEQQGWSFELVDLSESEVGGIKEAIAEISGDGVYGRLRFESGVHRVQRVPETESQGRVHTSAATVAILPEAAEVEIAIDEDKDLRIDSFSASGPGGQHVNRTASAVRLTHLPSGIVVQCQDEKSWHKNKSKALKVLRARLLDLALREQQAEEAAARRGQIGSGDRSEKVRTYNFPQNRITDHRVGLTLHNIEKVLEGEIDELVEALVERHQADRLGAETGH